MYGQGNINFTNNSKPATVADANNGLSLNGSFVQFGQDWNAALNTAQLTNSRSLPLNGFFLDFTGNNFGFKIDDQAGNIKAVDSFSNEIFLIDPLNVSVEVYTLEVNNVANFTSASNQILKHNGNLFLKEDYGNGFLTMGTGNATSLVSTVLIGRNILKNYLSSNARTVAVGSEPLYSMVSGIRNVAVGHAAGRSTSDTNDNVFIGASAGRSISATGSNNNVIVGSLAASAEDGSGIGNVSNSTIIGAYAMNGIKNLTAITNAIIVGYNSGKLSNLTDTMSNTTIIGNNIQTDLSNVVLLGRNDQNVLIGKPVTDNGHRLQVNGGISISDVLNIPALTPPTDTNDPSGSDGDFKRDTAGNLYLKVGAAWYQFVGNTTFTNILT